MELDAGMAGQNMSGYWSVRPKEYTSETVLEGTYPWLIRRSAYAGGEKIKGVGATDALEPLFKYNHQDKAVAAAQGLGIDGDAGDLARQLRKMIEGDLPDIYERKFGKSNQAELELLMIMENMENADANVVKGVQGASPRDASSQHPSVKQLSSQDVDFWPEEIPLLKMAMASKDIVNIPSELVKEMGGFEMTAAGQYDKDTGTVYKIGQSSSQIKSNVRGFLDASKSQDQRLYDRATSDIAALNTTLLGNAVGLSSGPKEIRDTHFQDLKRMNLKYGGNTELEAQASAATSAHMLLKNSTSGWLRKEGRRLMSRFKSFVDRAYLKSLKKGEAVSGPLGGQILIEQVTLEGGNIGFWAAKMTTGHTASHGVKGKIPTGPSQTTFDSAVRPQGGSIAGATVGSPGAISTNIPQIELLGTWVAQDKDLRRFIESWAVTALFKEAEAASIIGSEEIAQKSVDAMTNVGGKRIVGEVMKATFEASLKHGIKVTYGPAPIPSHTGILGLTSTGIAKGLEMKLQQLLSDGEVEQEVSDFYRRMMDMSNTLSDQWKMAVPPGTATGVKMSKEWTFGDGFVKGWTKHYLGLWGPTGDADGAYDNWSDTEYRHGENVSISPFLTSRRAGVGKFDSAKTKAGDYFPK